MFRRYVLGLVALAALFASTAILGVAQNGQLLGHVVMKQADGTQVPVAGAQIDVYRTDIAGKYETKTDKKGQFVFAGLPYVGTYIVTASQAGANPAWVPNVKAGRELDVILTLSPGDGSRLTLEQIKAALAGTAGTGQLTAEEKAKQAEREREIAEVNAQNEKAKNANEILARTFKAGNAALMAKNYDEAIKQYQEGLAADSAQSALLTNQAVAYKARGVEKYNAGVSAKDDAERNADLEAARSDFKAAAAASGKAAALVKAMTVPTAPDELERYNGNKLASYSTNAEAMRLLVTKVDQTQADAALAAYKDYIAIETDPVKKAKAQLDSAQMLLDAGAVDKSFAEFHAILETQPDNPDANLGAGLALFASGDKAKYQDAANYLQHYVDVAPDTHKFKADAKAILAELKNTDKVVPEKIAPTRRRRP
ncbi:MAG TPA: carboxypeptidase regulatory-like domain-containing protein [Pyrinomonadaceae bacterium]|jgi:tetratricopeptide (TPR) repeat protein|nr:carboxypeptidase regulatory-like domain-containing protein [Pyrinomonadaceae bacterium]